MDEYGSGDAMIWIFNIYCTHSYIYLYTFIYHFVQTNNNSKFRLPTTAQCDHRFALVFLNTTQKLSVKEDEKKKEKKHLKQKHKSRSVYRIRIGLLFSMIYLENRYTNICPSSMFNTKKSAHKGVRSINHVQYDSCKVARVEFTKFLCCLRVWALF